MNKLDKELKKFKRITTLIFTAFAILILVLIWFFSRAHFVIRVEPREAIVTVDNFPVKMTRTGKGSIYTNPGTHTVRVEADGYIGISREIVFKRGLTTNMEINLKEMPEQILLEKSGTFLTKGKNANEFLYLDESGRQLIKATIKPAEGNKTSIEKMALTDKRLSKIQEIIWSPTNDLALFRINNKIELFDFQKYDFINQTQRPWGEYIGNIAWRPDNEKIAYYYAPPTGERSIIFANIDNSEATRFLNLNDDGLEIENPILKWSPDSRWLLILPQSKRYEKNKIYLLDAYTRQLKTLTDFGDQTDAKFSPNGNYILYSTYSLDIKGDNPNLISTMGIDGKNQKALNLRADIVKTVWKSNSKDLITVNRNATNDAEYISIFDSIKIQKGSDSLVLPRDQKLKLLEISSDDKMIVYQTDKGIYASRLEE